MNKKIAEKIQKKNNAKKNKWEKCAIYRMSDIEDGISSQDRVLRRLYGTKIGRLFLRIFVKSWVSKIFGCLLDTSVSKIAIKPFVEKHNIDMSDCVKSSFDSYNDFFKRKLVADARTLDGTEGGFVSPCDSRLTIYDIDYTSTAKFNIKDSQYDLQQLLRDKRLAQRYKGGKLWLFRLCVDDYHRYIYNVSGMQSSVRRIDGVYHTVNPIASEYYKIYKENTREYCLIKTKYAGTILYMEVGALLVGKIENRHRKNCKVIKGQEKGNFAFGGSTIILITQKDTVCPLADIISNSSKHIETRVRQGELVGMIHLDNKIED